MAQQWKNGRLTDIECVPTSYQTRRWLEEGGIPTKTLEALNELDLAIDGADEADSSLNCIKGGGGCLMQEKIVQSAKRFVLIGDQRKHCETLGTHYKSIPIEVVPYGCEPVRRWISERQGGHLELRMDVRNCYPVFTENHNYILDWYFPQPLKKSWRELNAELISIPGVVETGLFLDVVDLAYFANEDGNVKVVEPKRKQ